MRGRTLTNCIINLEGDNRQRAVENGTLAVNVTRLF